MKNKFLLLRQPSKQKQKPLIDSPPKIKIVRRTKNVLKEVLIVLESVLF